MLRQVWKGMLLTGISLLVFSRMDAQESRYGIMDRSGDSVPGDVVLLNEDSVWVQLGDLINKPTLLSFVYYRCPGLCSPLLDGIAEIIDKTDLVLGKDFQVITIGIDDRESLSLARSKKDNYLRSVHHPNASRDWQFYLTDSLAVKKLTKATGWEFRRRGNDFTHAAGTILLTPKGMISQYFYGTFILPMHFHMAVEEAKQEKTAVSRLKDQKYCYPQGPASNALYSRIVSTAGIGILSLAAFLFIWLSLAKRRNHPSRHSEKHGTLPIR